MTVNHGTVVVDDADVAAAAGGGAASCTWFALRIPWPIRRLERRQVALAERLVVYPPAEVDHLVAQWV